MINLKFRALNKEAVLPFKATPFDAAFDITATSVIHDLDNDVIVYSTGLAVEIPEGHVGLLFPRSSIYKYSLSLSNSIGVIDAKYRQELLFKFRPQGAGKIYSPGDRIGQLIVIPFPQFNPVFVGELDMNNDRGGGFGSTDKK